MDVNKVSMNMSNFIGANCDCRQSQSGQSTLSQFALFRALLRNEIRHVFVRRSQIKVHRKAYDIRLKFSWMWTLMNMSNFIGANCDCRQSQSGQSTLSQFALFRHCLRNEIRHVFVRRSQIKVHRKAYDIRLKFSWMWTLMNMSNFIGANCDCRQSQSGQSTLSQFALFRHCLRNEIRLKFSWMWTLKIWICAV